MHNEGMLILLNNAAKLTGVKEKFLIGAHGLEALIAKKSARRLANLRERERSSRDSEMTAERETIVRTLLTPRKALARSWRNPTKCSMRLNLVIATGNMQTCILNR